MIARQAIAQAGAPHTGENCIVRRNRGRDSTEHRADREEQGRENFV
jgi:hypothetical protein